MSIPPGGQFDYEIILTRTSSRGWSGQAAPPEDDSRHPGLAGARPNLQLLNGVVSLRRTESSSRIAASYGDFQRPLSLVSFQIGAALEAVAEEGDVLRVLRGGTADLGITLFRGEHFLMGMGAVIRRPLAPSMIIHEDPRAYEVSLYCVASTLDEPDTTLVWLDSSDPRLDTVISGLERLPGKRLVVAITGPTAEARLEVNRRMPVSLFASTHSSRHYVDVDPRFATCEQWITYLHQLPKARPNDLYLRFTLNGEEIDLREGEYAFKRPWHLFVAKVYKPGLPGECSQLAVVREHGAVLMQMVIDSTRLIASRRFEMKR